MKEACDRARRSFRVITLGCKVNQYESAFFKESLLQAGMKDAAEDKTADVVLINTCTVTASASRQSRQAIRKAIRENPGALVCVVGCYVQAFPDELNSIVGIDITVGNKRKKDVPLLILEGLRQPSFVRSVCAFEKGDTFESMPVRRHPDRTRASLKIQDGCESFCSYCIVPLARGPVRSLPPREIGAILDSMAEQGVMEVVLTGIHLGRYGVDLSPRESLLSLLDYMGRLSLPLRIRLSSIEPTELDSELISFIASQRWVCKHLHIPLQSGDQRILKAMNRHYSPERFALLIEQVRSAMPLAAIGVDVMCGFPGESAEAHENTVSLIKETSITYLHAFPYSPRPGTHAAAMGHTIDPSELKDRTSQLRAIGREKRLSFHRLCLGNEFEALFEGPYKSDPRLVRGTSDNYLPIISRREPRTEAHGFVRVIADGIRGQLVTASPSPA